MRKNEFTGGLIHFVAALLSVEALIILIDSALSRPDRNISLPAFGIFGLGLVIQYTVSTIYHLTPVRHPLKTFWQSFDHSAVFFLIAASYTPICLLALPTSWSYFYLTTSWSATIIGTFYKFFINKLSISWLTVIYLLISWLAILSIRSLIRNIGFPGLYWLFLEAAFYSIGTVFFALEKKHQPTGWFGYHEIFHIFLILAGFCHFWLVIKYL